MPTPTVKEKDLGGRGWTSSWQPDPARRPPAGTPPPREKTMNEAIVEARILAQELARTGHVHQAQQ